MPSIRKVARRKHGRRLISELNNAWAQLDQARDRLDLDGLRANGSVIVVEGAHEHRLKTDSLEQYSRHRPNPRPMWLLLSDRPETGWSLEHAQVWVADEYRAAFLRRFEQFLENETATGAPRHNSLVANIEHIRPCTLGDLWRSAGRPPRTGSHWWELRLRPTDDALDLALLYAKTKGLQITPRALRFGKRSVVWVRARWADLTDLPLTSVPIAELRRPAVVETVDELEYADQHQYMFDLMDNIDEADDFFPAACVLIEARVIFADVVELDEPELDEEEVDESE